MADIVFVVGHYTDEEELHWKLPLVPSAAPGKQFDTLLADAGLGRGSGKIIAVFPTLPEDGNILNECVKKQDPNAAYGLPALATGKYLPARYVDALESFDRTLAALRPNVVVALGGVAAWAVTGSSGIDAIRGTLRLGARYAGKVLPTYHPRDILRQYDLRHTTVLDLKKAKRHSGSPDFVRPVREIHIAETIEDIEEFKRLYLLSATQLAFDIETSMGQITCIGFAPSIDRALVIPIIDPRCPRGNYWPTLSQELIVWRLIAEILALPNCSKCGQNTLYDIQYLWQAYGIPVVRYEHDTMLLHHSLQPEALKGLGYLGSVYTDEPAWKADRPRGGDDTIKREDD
jgi:uracil-DNA glycosylase